MSQTNLDHTEAHNVTVTEPNYDQEATQEVSQEEKRSSQPTQESSDTAGIRNLRTAKERLEYENRELQARLKRIEEEQQKAKYDPDELVERKYVDEQIRKQRQEIAQMSTEYKLKTNYPDFDKVVNEATVAKLKEKNPTIAAAIGQVGDAYSQAAAAYEAIKNFSIYEEDTYSDQRNKAHENANKPRPIQSLSPQKGEGDSAVQGASAFGEGLTDERKKQIWKEMQHYMKQPSS